MNGFRRVRGSTCKVASIVGCSVLALFSSCSALDREAFTATNYVLDVRLEPAQQRMSVRGKITLRNDSSQPQRVAALQISSSLNWRSIRVVRDTKASADTPETGAAVQFLTQPYTSDIDHTGELSEALVTLPRELQPKESATLLIGYEGVVVLDATRLTRVGTPENVARHSDWDQIGRTFSAVRGAGYVTWYPVAMEAQNLLEGGALFAALGKWKARHAESKMELRFELMPGAGEKPELLVNGTGCSKPEDAKSGVVVINGCVFDGLGRASPVFAIGSFEPLNQGDARMHVLPEHAAAAGEFTKAADRAEYLVQDWFGPPRQKIEVVDLADPEAAPFEAGAWLLLPLARSRPEVEHSLAIHQLTHASFPSQRLWQYEGAAYFAQAVAKEKDGRAAALDYLTAHRDTLLPWETQATKQSESLVNATQEAVYHSKAALVWWMLRDMVGDAAFKRALHAYRAEDDTDAAYFEHVLQTVSKRDLGWFFHDWVYTDAGLPNLRIDSANARLTNGTSFITAVSVVNAGGAGAEVPVTVHTESGDFTERLEVRAKSRAVTRVASPAQPLEVIVNDGSVPESGLAEHRMKIDRMKIGGEEMVPGPNKP